MNPKQLGPKDDNEAQRVYLRFRRVFGDPSTRSRDARRRIARSGAPSQPFGSGRDPKGIADVILGVTTELGWNSTLAQSDLMIAWPEMVGAELAGHSVPVGIEDGTLTVQCDSTAWATQLRLMRAQVTTSIVTTYPEAGIESIRFLGPNAPTWNAAPDRFQGVALAILTVEKGDSVTRLIKMALRAFFAPSSDLLR